MDSTTIFTISLSTAVSIISLITSVVTVYLNNKNQKQIKILDIVYDKKYNTYKNFFEIYTKYFITHEYDKDEITNAIMHCLTIANTTSKQHLKMLLKNINSPEIKKLLPNVIPENFHNCAEALRIELQLK